MQQLSDTVASIDSTMHAVDIDSDDIEEPVPLPCWKSIDTALYYIHLAGRHVLDAARAARPALPAGHVEDRA